MNIYNMWALRMAEPNDWSPGVTKIGSLYSMYRYMSLTNELVLFVAKPSQP